MDYLDIVRILERDITHQNYKLIDDWIVSS